MPEANHGGEVTRPNRECNSPDWGHELDTVRGALRMTAAVLVKRDRQLDELENENSRLRRLVSALRRKLSQKRANG